MSKSQPFDLEDKMITKTGTVTVSEHGILIDGFHFSGVIFGGAQVEVLTWAIKQLNDELVKMSGGKMNHPFFETKTQRRLKLITTQLLTIGNEQTKILELFRRGNDMSQQVLDEQKKKPEPRKKIIVEYEKYGKAVTVKLTGTRFNCIEREKAALIYDDRDIIATFYNVISIRYAEGI